MDKNKWLVVLDTLCFHKMRGISSLAKELAAFQKGLCSIDFVIMP
jgi:hypothetical protein